MENGRHLSRKERLFDCYAANLSACRREYTDLFACPLCLRLFDREALAAGDVTEEHIVPSSLGGRIVTLTCRECNCPAGSQLESSLTDRLREQDWDQGIGDIPRRGSTRVEGGTITLDVHHRNGAYYIQPYQHLSDPRSFRLAIPKWESEGVPAGLEVEWTRAYEGKRSWVAVLRMGYLLAFGYFGYGYIMHQNLQQVRDQIKCPDELAISAEAVRCVEQWPYARNLLGLLYAPSRLKCFFAVVEVSTDLVRHYGVVLPGLDAQSRDVYNRWGDSAGGMAKIQPKAVFLPFDSDLVCDPTKADFAIRLWSTWRKPLPTWAAGSEFHYDGSVDRGTDIWYGNKLYCTRVTQEQYSCLIEEFRGCTVPIGTSREPPLGSVGAWLQQHVTRRAIASYVGPILVNEGYAERVPSDSTKIRFKRGR